MLPLAHIKIFTIFALRNLHNRVNHRIYGISHKRLGVVYLNSNNSVISGFRNFESITLSLFNKSKFFTKNAKPSRKFSPREQQYLDANGNSTTRSTCNYSLSKSFCKKINDNIFVVVKNFLTFVLPNLSSKVNHRFCKNIKRISVVFLNPYSFAVGRFGDLEKATLSLYLKVKIFYDAKPSRKLHTREQEYLVCNGNSTIRSQCNYFSVHGLFFRGVSAVLRTHAAQTHSAQYYSAGQRFQNLLRSGQAKMLLRAGGEFHTGTYRLGAGYALQNRGIEEHFFHFIN